MMKLNKFHTIIANTPEATKESIGLYLDELENNPKIQRTTAMQWWNSLNDNERADYCSKHYTSRLWQSLTGREIQTIYAMSR